MQMMSYMKADIIGGGGGGGYSPMNGLGGGGPNSQMSQYLKAQQSAYSSAVNGMALSSPSDLLHGNVAYPNSKCPHETSWKFQLKKKEMKSAKMISEKIKMLRYIELNHIHFPIFIQMFCECFIIIS